MAQYSAWVRVKVTVAPAQMQVIERALRRYLLRAFEQRGYIPLGTPALWDMEVELGREGLGLTDDEMVIAVRVEGARPLTNFA